MTIRGTSRPVVQFLVRGQIGGGVIRGIVGDSGDNEPVTINLVTQGKADNLTVQGGVDNLVAQGS